MGLTTHHTERDGGELRAPAPAPSAQRCEADIAQIEAAVVKGGGTLDPMTRDAVRQFSERVLSNYEGHERAKIIEAAILAAELHAPQGMRLDGIPFVTHPFTVALTLQETLGIRDAALVCAALLHDTVEDHPARLAVLSGGLRREWPGRSGDKAEALHVIRDRFGDRIAEVVDRLTNKDWAAMVTAAGPEASLGKFPRNHFYREHILEMLHGTDRRTQEAFAVKMADIFPNIWGIDALRALHYFAEVERLEDKRRPLARAIADRMGELTAEHPLHPVRQRVAELLEIELRKMAPISA